MKSPHRVQSQLHNILEKQNYGDSKKMNCCPGLGVEGE